MPIRPENLALFEMPQNRTLNESARMGRQVRGQLMACAQCGAMFAPYLNKRARFCSEACRKAAHRPDYLKTPKPCAGCGAAFTPIKSMKAAFCSAACMRRKYRRDMKADPERLDRHRKAARLRSKGERFRHSQANFNAKRRAAERTGSLTWAEWRLILDRFDHCCAYYRAEGVKLTRDHVVALSNGGAHDASNVVPACQSCNSAKCDLNWGRPVPIKKENIGRYPKDWKLRSYFVRFVRAKGLCEWCGAAHGKPHPVTGSIVVLTTAHVFDDSPEASGLLNLASLCQKCHNSHDMKARAQRRRERQVKESGQMEFPT